mmetsp:Transcript_31485/g.46446  ORF Transcript_31485/g.46446 Transcript_31485/m.46446 type:complete len:549 (+) Transcript_31485:153-1799(+)
MRLLGVITACAAFHVFLIIHITNRIPTATAFSQQDLRYVQSRVVPNHRRYISTTPDLSERRGSSTSLSAFTGILRNGAATFLADWKTLSFIPFVAAFVGWFTNYLAVKMIFYPIIWRGIDIKRIEGEPLGLFGWQGIIPAKTTKMSEAMVNVTINELISMEKTIQKLDPDEVADILVPQVPEMVEDILGDDSDESEKPMPVYLQNLAKSMLDEDNAAGQWIIKKWLGRSFLTEFTRAMQRDITNLFNVRNCVVVQMMKDRSLLGKLFEKTGHTELDFLVDSGLWFGFLLGCIQLIVALYCSNPWTLSIGGLIVGLATNWLALKWIFEPVEPTKVGPFVLQGLFLRRQPEVSKDFSEFFTKKILNSREMWNSIINDPDTSSKFRQMFSQQLVDLSSRATGGTNTIKEDKEELGRAVSKLISRLQYHFEKASFHDYVDKKLGIEKTLRTGLERLSFKEFEQVLHPIFEEDELTLILAGGFLGFSAGFIQQLLSTGVWSLPTWSSLFAVTTYTAIFMQNVKKVALVGGIVLGIPALIKMLKKKKLKLSLQR